MNSLLGVLVFDKAPSEAVHHALVQLVPFEAPFAGILWAPADILQSMKDSLKRIEQEVITSCDSSLNVNQERDAISPQDATEQSAPE